MHVLDIWLEQLKVFYPANLKIFVLGIAKQLAATFKFLFIDWWWLSWFFLFSHLAMYGLMGLTSSSVILYIFQIVVFAAHVYFAYLAILSTFWIGAFESPESHLYIASRHAFFWPIVTPFVLWIYFHRHIYKFFSLLLSPQIVATFSKYASFALLTNVDWFASPLFVFYAFIIIGSYVQYGVWHALEYAFEQFWAMYPLCVLMFGCVYGLQIVLERGLEALALVDSRLLLLFNPMAILIPVAVVLFDSVYQWYMELAYWRLLKIGKGIT